MKNKIFHWVATILLCLVFSGIFTCGKSKKGTLEVSPELRKVLEITHRLEVLRLGSYAEAMVNGGIRNIGNKELNLSVIVEFYDVKKRLLKTADGIGLGFGLPQSVRLKPEKYISFSATPGLNPDVFASYKIIITSETREDVSEKPLPLHKAYSVNLYIQSNVGGADVYVNGERQASGTKSTDLKASIFGLRPGKYEIRLKKEGYKDTVQTVELTGDKAVGIIIMEMEVNP